MIKTVAAYSLMGAAISRVAEPNLFGHEFLRLDGEVVGVFSRHEFVDERVRFFQPVVVVVVVAACSGV